MRIIKKGLIYCPSGEHEWEMHTFTTPHPLLISDDVIRIWGGVRDKNGISRIKYIDVAAEDPGKVLYISDKISLDIGNTGCFDDNGMILGDILPVKEKLYMYYVGFQHVEKVKFFAFSGLAISDDGGVTFKRNSETPILDRTDHARYGRCIHCVVHRENVFGCYYTAINKWQKIGQSYYPSYNIWYTESSDGIHFDDSLYSPRFCVDYNADEYRIGRPRVYQTDEGYEMLYTRDFIKRDYVIGYAVSKDGINDWTRKDDKYIIEKSESGWDSEMACYANLLQTNYGKYVFYNGNGIGQTGVGYAEIVD